MAAHTNEDYFVDVDENDSDLFKVERADWKKLEEERKKEGYREGLESGEEEALQSGHDDGFRSTSSLFHLMRLRGVLMAVQCCSFQCHIKNSDDAESMSKQAESLEAEILQLEHEWQSRFDRTCVTDDPLPLAISCTVDSDADATRKIMACKTDHGVPDLLASIVAGFTSTANLCVTDERCRLEYNRCVTKLQRLLCSISMSASTS